VADTDYILYISALPCVEGPTLAFAAACQMESQLDRPIAGYINFCPNNLGETTRDYLFQVAKHELFHALGFSYSLMALWRDSSGDRRTPR
jgi:leishmanolysin-like peptidase